MAPFRNLLKVPHASTPTRRGAKSASVRIVAVTMFVLALVGGLSLVPKQQAHASTVQGVLLLIHGYTDNCTDAFDSTDNMGGTPNNSTTAGFLLDRGWGNWYDPMIEVGYDTNLPSGYTSDSASVCPQFPPPGTNGTPTYDYNLQHFDSAGTCAQYVTTRSGAQAGGYNDPIEHLGCLLAWYIHVNFTNNQIPVYIVAHSMGGLIVRDAIGESEGKNSAFPTTLDVRKVVTIATPHGGVCCYYNQLAQHLPSGDSVEVEDMLPGSSHSNFMQLMSGIQSPQATYGTSWDLMAGSDTTLCYTPETGSQAVSCGAEQALINNPYPDGDGIVQASSALAMSGAAQKVLYGEVAYEPPLNPIYTATIADTQTEYAHETKTCLSWPSSVCLGSPDFLNDGTLGPGTTKAWVCYAPNCTDSTLNFNDMNVSGSAVSAPRSLQQVADWLPALAAPTPTPTATATPAPGACVQQPNDAHCDNQDYIQQGCNAYPQSQTYSSSILYVQLYYSTNCQSNWTSAKTVASGYQLHQVWIERQETLAYAALTYSNVVASPTWYTNMVWAPVSPARSCASYKNLSTGAISGAYCTAWSPVSTTCKSSLSDAHCTGQDYVVQGCNAYAQSSPAPISNSYVKLTDYYSTNCQSNWAVATLVADPSNWQITSVTVNRGARSGYLGSASETSHNLRSDTTWWSQMVYAPNNPTQVCVTYESISPYHIYGPVCTSMA